MPPTALASILWCGKHSMLVGLAVRAEYACRPRLWHRSCGAASIQCLLGSLCAQSMHACHGSGIDLVVRQAFNACWARCARRVCMPATALASILWCGKHSMLVGLAVRAEYACL